MPGLPYPSQPANLDDLAELAGAILSAGGGMRIRAYGQSMRPWILPGDELVLHPVQGENILTGDVLLCKLSTGRLVAHRVVQIQPAGRQADGTPLFLLQGDALALPDGYVGIENVLGRVVEIWRGERQIRLAAPFLRLAIGLWLVPGFKRLYWSVRTHLRSCLAFVKQL